MTYSLAEPIENLIADRSCEKFDQDCGVLIVGSGYGGAIAAMRLADEKRDVFVFERGNEYATGDFPESLGQLPGHIQFLRDNRDLPIGYADALFDFRINNPVSVLVGCGLGGGSLINANVAMEPGDDLFDDPMWPNVLNKNALRPSFDAVRELLGVNTKNTYLQKFGVLKELADSLHEVCEPAPISVTRNNNPKEKVRNAVGFYQNPCTGCGNCVTGCNVGAKNTLPMNVLPLAKSRGAKLYTGATVLSVEPDDASDGSNGWKVRFCRTATLKTVLHKEVFTLRATVVILAAGTLGSTEILLRSQERGRVKFSHRLGERFSTNGDMLAFGCAQEEEVNAVATPDTPPDERNIGPTITGYVKADLGSKQNGKETGRRPRVTIEDGAVPSALAQVFGEVLATASVFKRNTKSGLPAWFEKNRDKDPLAVHAKSLRHSQVLLVMGDDEAQYKMELKLCEEDALADPDRMRIRIGDSPTEPSVFGAVNNLLEQAETRGGFDGGDYLPNPFWKVVPDALSKSLPAPRGQLLSVHPLGGCPMGDNAKSGVVNHCGQVFNSDGSLYDGLYVMDGAIIPCALGVNPFLTIASLAYRNAEYVADNHSWQVQDLNLTVGKSIKHESRVGEDATLKPDPAGYAAPTNPESTKESRLSGGDASPAPAGGIKGKFVEFMTGKLNIDKVPRWVIETFGSREAEWLNQKNRLVLQVEIEIDDVMRWLSAPNSVLNATATLSVNTGPTNRVQRDKLVPLGEDKCNGKAVLLASDQPGWLKKIGRALCAISAFIEKRGLGDATGTLNWLNPWEVIKATIGFLRVAWNHANWRQLSYEFTFQTKSGKVILQGTKELAYALGKKDPWSALAELPFTLRGPDDSVEGLLCVDLVRLTRRTPFQVEGSPDTPTTIMAMASAGMMFFRVLFQTHLWSFGAPDYPVRSPIGNRNPGPLRLNDWTTINPEQSFFEVPVSSRDNPERIRLRLLRYQPAKAENGSILIIHGLATSSLAFATDTIDVNMATYLCRHGYDVWLLDYRLSIALPHAARQWTMDQIAQHDMPAAVKYVYEQTGGPIQVFAHCIGAGSLAMAILTGKCHDRNYINEDGSEGRSMISALVTHAVHPWMVPSVMNHLKINLAAFFWDSIAQRTFDSVLPVDAAKKDFDVMLDRIAGSLPWPLRGNTQEEDETEQFLHRSKTDERKGKDICNRLSLFYGFEWWHGNLSGKTHRRIADLLGVVNLETVRQIYFILFRRRLTTRSGANHYVTADNFKQYWTFPTLFAHGQDSQLYDPASAVNSCLRLRSLREQAGAANGPNYDVYWFQVPNCGHMDFLFGKNAGTKVYPTLDAFFRQAQRKPLSQGLRVDWNQTVEKTQGLGSDKDPDWKYGATPYCGPIIEYAPRDENEIKLRLWVEPILFSAITPSGRPVEPPRDIQINYCPLPANPDDPGTDPDDPGTIPDYPGTYWIYDVSVPRDFSQDLRISVDYSDRADIRFKVEEVPPSERGATEAEKEDYEDLHDEEKGVRIPLSDLPWFTRLQGKRKRNGVAFLVGSCRYPGSPFDRDLADSIFEPMWEQVKADDGVDHVLLVGDQIYADATVDAFNLQELRERFARQYREAFKAKYMRRLLASVPTYMALDDHEFDDNWPGNASELSDEDPIVIKYNENFRHGLAAAKAYQWAHSPRNGVPDDPAWSPTSHDQGLWYTFESGELPFFVMDTRTERKLRKAHISHEVAQLVGKRQLCALKDWLANSDNKDKPKFIVSGSALAPVTRKFTQQKWLWRNNDGWAGYPKTWRELVRHIVDNQIRNVVFIAGDYHLSAVAQLTLRSKNKERVIAYQIAASALFAPLPFANAKPSDYSWANAIPSRIPLPFSDFDATLEVEPYLLSTNSSHFLRVEADPVDNGKWSMAIRVCDSTGVIAPEEFVQHLFTKGEDNAIRWTL